MACESLMGKLLWLLQEALQRFVGAMAGYRETHTLGEEEAALLQNACVCLTDTLCPFIAERLSRIFPTPANLMEMSAITAPLRETEAPHDEKKHILRPAEDSIGL